MMSGSVGSKAGRRGHSGAVALIGIGLLAAAVSARAPQPAPAKPSPSVAAPADAMVPLAVLSGVQPGLWEVRRLDRAGDPVERLCLADPALLAQLAHRRPGCARLVIDNAPQSATVQYSCTGAGWGRTTLRAGGRDMLRIETQGIADNAPFAYSASGRRLGDCSGSGNGGGSVAALAH